MTAAMEPRIAALEAKVEELDQRGSRALVALQQQVEDLERTLAMHERRQEGEFAAITTKLDDIQKQLATRLPMWATLLMTGMGTIIGILVGVISTHRLA